MPLLSLMGQCFRKMCSTPQKQPAAKVATWDVGTDVDMPGVFWGTYGLRLRRERGEERRREKGDIGET